MLLLYNGIACIFLTFKTKDIWHLLTQLTTTELFKFIFREPKKHPTPMVCVPRRSTGRRFKVLENQGMNLRFKHHH